MTKKLVAISATVAAGVVCLLLLAGCTTPPAGPDAGSGAAVDYPEVTEDQYRAAFEQYSSCMGDAGYPVEVLDDSVAVIQYSYLGTAVDDGTEAGCYESFAPIDEAWQVANEDTSVGALRIRACLEDNGIEPVGTATGDWELVMKHDLMDTCH